MRICYVANPYSIHTQRQVRYFAERGYDISLIGVSPDPGTLAPDTFPKNVVYYDMMANSNVRKLRFLHWGMSARRLVHKIRPDILHAHQVAGNGWVGAATGYHPFLVTAWGSDLLLGPSRSRIQRQLAKWTLRRADYVTCVSPKLVEAAQSLGADSNQLELAPWGIDTDVYYPDSRRNRRTIRSQLGLPEEAPVVLSIRAVRAIYNPLDIAQAIAYVLAQIPSAHFVIRTYSYDLDLLNQFKAIVQAHDAAHAVHYLGDVSSESRETAIADLYRASDVAVSIPASDGTPSSVMEALGCGTALVLSDLPALRDWIEHEREGLFVPVNDVKALGATIVRLLADRSLREKLTSNGVALVRRRFDSRHLMNRTEEIYYQLVASN